MTVYDLVAFYVVPPEWFVSEDEVFAKKMSLSVSKSWPVFVFYFLHCVVLCSKTCNSESWRHVSVIAHQLIRPRLNQSSLLDITCSDFIIGICRIYICVCILYIHTYIYILNVVFRDVYKKCKIEV